MKPTHKQRICGLQICEPYRFRPQEMRGLKELNTHGPFAAVLAIFQDNPASISATAHVDHRRLIGLTSCIRKV